MKILSITNIFNFSGITLIIIFSAFLGYERLAAELGIIIGCSVFFTQVFSSNSRNLLIIKFTKINYKKRILIRIVFSLLILVFINIFNFLYFGNLSFISATISIIIVLQWINEIYLLSLWQYKNIKKIKIYLSICLIYYSSIFVNFIFGSVNNFKICNILFILINLSFLSHIFFEIKDSNFKKIKKIVINIFLKDLNNSSFYSSSSMVFSNFISRIIIFETIPIKLSGILFACFSLGSIPGSIFNNTFGPYFVKNKINLFSFKIFILFLSILFGSLFLLFNKNQIIFFFPYLISFTLESLFLSLIGSLFMISGLYYRQLLLFKSIFYIKRIFNLDILNSAVYIIIVSFVALNAELIYFPYIFLIFSIYNFIIFFSSFNYSKVK